MRSLMAANENRAASAVEMLVAQSREIDSALIRDDILYSDSVMAFTENGPANRIL